MSNEIKPCSSFFLLQCPKFSCIALSIKKDTYRFHTTIGGDRLEHECFIFNLSDALSAVNIHLNRTVSIPDALRLTLDIPYYYYGTPMHECEHAQIPCYFIPQESINRCNLTSLAVKRKDFCEVRKGIPGLKKSGIIAHQRLLDHLHKYD